MSNVEKKGKGARRFDLPEIGITSDERSQAKAMQEIVGILKRFRLSEGAMWKTLNDAGEFCQS